MKKLLYIQSSDTPHWVGDGFPVRSIFSYDELGQEVSPFLLLDYAGPTEFSPSKVRRGVDAHPHRGFETVTIVYSGEVEHRDSAGGGGIIRPGDVQWMTAASGLVHEEMHSQDYSERGGRFEMVQLWVNLPRKDKMASPRYQALRSSAIPSFELPDGAGRLRVIAGAWESHKGPAQTFSPMNLWDIELKAGSHSVFGVPHGHTAAVFVLSGKVSVPGGMLISPAQIAIFEREGEAFELFAHEDAKLLFMGGAPIQESLAGFGPFVMNTFEEVHQAFQDFDAGKMGKIENLSGAR
jgi:redox-sensitive bicupin YhaK (pirin superfamily)